MKEEEKKIYEILEEKGVRVDCPAAEGADCENRREAAPRAKKLMDLYYQSLASTSMEWTYWYTRKFEEEDGELQIIRRAKALACAFAHTTPVIYPGELLVGAKTGYLRGTFPMPWLIQSFFVSKSSELFEKYKSDSSSRQAVDQAAELGLGGGNVTADLPGVISLAGKFGLRASEVPMLNKITEYWSGKTIEEIGEKHSRWVPDFEVKNNLTRTLTSRGDSAYTVPVGREVVSYYYPLQMGFDAMIELCRQRASQVAGNADGDGVSGMDRLYFYEAAAIVTEGIQKWILNYAKEAERRASLAKPGRQKEEYAEIAEICGWIAHKQPRTFREAMQLSYFTHLALLNEEVASGVAPGRVGQVLWPWFEQDMEAGRLTEEQALELLELYRVKFTAIDLFVSSGSNSVLMGNTFNNLCVGGLTREGLPACNRLEYLILEAGMALPSPQPTLSVLWDERLPEEFVLKCAEVVKIGAGYPAWMNNRVATDFLLRQYGSEGMTVEEARAFSIGGCLETAPGCWKELTLNGKTYEIPVGASNSTSVGVHFISNPKVLSLVLFNGKDVKNHIQLLPPHNKSLDTYEELWAQFKEYYEYIIEVQRRCCNIQHDIWRKKNVPIWQSVLKPDCLDKGLHGGNMGFRYNATYNIETTGTVTMVNSLAALKKLVYEEKKYTLEDMKDALLNNFGYYLSSEIKSNSISEQVRRPDGDRYDDIYGDCLTANKYGNADPYTDSILHEYETWLCGTCANFESLYAKPMYACQISVSSHGLLGSGCGATPDGRLAETTFADASMSAYPGTDKNGPYALFTSAVCWDHSASQNSQMNMKIHPSAIRGDAGTKHLAELAKSYLRKGGFHIQFNVVDNRTLKAAQARPESYRDLMVRVAGFTQYWVEIGKAIQDEVIARTEYEEV